MACPLCGEHCRCSYVAPLGTSGRGTSFAQHTHDDPAESAAFIDPECYEPTEEQFAASVAGIQAEAARMAATHVAARSSEINIMDDWHSGAPPGQTGLALDSDWRQQVASRVESYRVRRKRPPRERSLRFDFEPQWAGPRVEQERCSSTAIEHADAVVDEQSVYPGMPGLAAPELKGGTTPVREREPEPPVPETKIIEFPRSAFCPTICEELAEPVLDKPRILDVPEEVPVAPSALADISLEPAVDSEPARDFALELPLQVAPMARRAAAGALDAALVLLGAGLFLGVAMKSSVEIPHTKTAVAALLAMPCIFWTVYQYLFLVHAGTTPGLQAARLRLASFDGERVTRFNRRWRALGMLLSCFPLGLGLAWAFFDEDALCWHDRISRTYVANSAVGS